MRVAPRAWGSAIQRAGADGRALRDFADRDEVVIEVEHSLRRLGTDYIDLYQVHRNDHATPLEETLEALSEPVRAGKVRYLGASSMHAWEFAKALHMQQANGWARFVSMQDHYNLLAREEEREMIPLCLELLAGGGGLQPRDHRRGRAGRRRARRQPGADRAGLAGTPGRGHRAPGRRRVDRADR